MQQLCLFLSLGLLWSLMSAAHAACEAGDAFLNKQAYAQAVKAYSACLDKQPDPNDYFNRAGAYTGLKQYPKAIADYGQVLQRLPLDNEAYYRRGMLQQHLKKHALALKDFELAAELKPDHTPYTKALASSYYYNRLWAKALPHLNAVIKQDSKDADLWYQRGVTHVRLNKTTQALNDFSQTLQRSPRRANAWYNRGLLYQSLKNCPRANYDFKKACGLGDKAACKTRCKSSR